MSKEITGSGCGFRVEHRGAAGPLSLSAAAEPSGQAVAGFGQPL